MSSVMKASGRKERRQRPCMHWHQDVGPPEREREHCSNNCSRNPGWRSPLPLSSPESTAESNSHPIWWFNALAKGSLKQTLALVVNASINDKHPYPTYSVTNDWKANDAAQSLAGRMGRVIARETRPRHTIESLLLHMKRPGTIE